MGKIAFWMGQGAGATRALAPRDKARQGDPTELGTKMSAHEETRPRRPRALRVRWWVASALILGISGQPDSARGEGEQLSFSGGLGLKNKIDGNPLLRGNGKLSGNHEVDLRNLESDFRPTASRHLVSLSEQYIILNNPTWRLSLVRALARHAKEQTKTESIQLETLRALISLIDAPEELSEDSTQAEVERGALRHLARGTAAMALARSRHPLALKKLLAMALGGDEVDPTGTRIALAALRALPRETLRTEELGSLFSAADIDKIYQTTNNSSFSEILTERKKAEAFSPKTLVLAAKPPEPPHHTQSAVPEAAADFLSFEAMIAQLLQEPALPRTFARVAPWEEAMKAEPVWTLRALGLLGARLEAPVITWGARAALGRTRSKSKLERSEAAWCSAVLAPESTLALLKRADPIITRAVLRQGSEGDVSRHIATLLQEKALTEEASRLALGMILQDKARWPDLSTAFLRSVETTPGDAVRAALSSRLRASGPGLGPDVEAVRNWLNNPSPEVRKAVAFGLSMASLGSAQGLLFEAYRKESDAPTRLALVASIFTTPLARSDEFRELLELDPDERCRDFLSEAGPPRRIGAHLSWSTRKTTTVSDSEGRLLEVAPAPDGFVGIVRSSF